MKVSELIKMLESIPDKNQDIVIKMRGKRAWATTIGKRAPYKPRRYWKTLGWNKFFTCPNCQAIYEMVPIKEIAELCKRCRHKKPKVVMCRRGVNQYTKRTKCAWRQYNGKGKR